jgi:dUTPase
LVVHHLSHELMVLQGSVDPDYQGSLFELITKMKDDFESRWGTRVQYFSTTQ